MPAHAVSVFGVAEGDGEFERLAVTSREMLQVERSYRGFSAQAYFKDVTIENLYKVAYVVLRMRGRIETVKNGGPTYEEFVDGWSVMLNDPEHLARAKALAQKLADEGASIEDINEALATQLGPGYDATEEDEGSGQPVDPTQAIA